ncbi:hypothetical protein CN120_20335 [Sinorhizobium meliloti]|uniref:nSTAND3 domain-containing NTPase n=1 Tax=Rhizobium meliloti TaxID=382 RepID=UPI000FD98A3A|nr:hypothetical protein [Sinorhizobium meliloti]RVN01763.1 hypothetical protein CN120_20335 [Sinorhizobium meliloti]
MSDISESADDTVSSGTTALEGFVYQKSVSVWIALDLIMVRKATPQVVLEPIEQDDLEADIEGEPGAMAQTTPLDDYTLVVQCKLKSTGPWTHQEIGRLLSHGKKRQSAADRLKNEKTRYLLVTSADLQGVARELQVKEIGVWPDASGMPAGIAALLPTTACGRVGVLAPFDQERVNARIDVVLTERFRVPTTRLTECRARLETRAFERMLGGNGGVWTHSEIETEIRGFGGYSGESADLEDFVQPTNWEALKEALDTRHAVIITGASGTGKTKTAKALIADLRDRSPGFEHRIVRGGPDKIFEYSGRGPVVFEIEDPWGKFRLDESAAPWNDALDGLLQQASSDRKFVVTSRSDVLKESAPRNLRPKWFTQLEEENYGLSQRRRLFTNRLPGLPFELRNLAARFQTQAIEGLATPLELHRYFSVLADGPDPDERDGDYISRCLKDAHQNSIELSIVSNVRYRDDWCWAALTWGMFKANQRWSTNVLPRVQAVLAQMDATLEDGLTRYISFLVAGRNLRQSDVELSYQHPRVELGLEQAMLQRPNMSASRLTVLLRALVELDRRSNSDWGTEGAARLMAALARQEDLHPDPPAETISVIDIWLESRLSATGEDFEDDLRLAAAAGSPASQLAEVARWLTYRDPKREWHAFDEWAPPDQSDGWYARIAADPRTRQVCEAFIKRSLTRGHGRFDGDYHVSIARLSSDLGSAFVEAASMIVMSGYHPNEDAIIAGAMQDAPGFERVVAEAVAFIEKEDADDDPALFLALRNGEYDEAAAEHYYEDAGERGHGAREILETYVRQKRSAEGWKAVAEHPLAKGLVEAWLQILQKERDITEEEWTTVANLSRDWTESRLWELLRDRLPAGLEDRLEKRLLEGHIRRDVRVEAAKIAIVSAPHLIGKVVDALSTSAAYARILDLAFDIVGASEGYDGRDNTRSIAEITGQLASPMSAVVATVFEQNPVPLTEDAVEILLESGCAASLKVDVFRARLLHASGIGIADDLRRILEDVSDNREETITAVTDAVELAERAGHSDLVAMALAHRFADVRQQALVAIAARTKAPLPQELLDLAEDKGSRVRRQLVEILDDKRHSEHIPTLIRLCGDQWTRQQYHYEEPADYPIAVGASEILMTEQIADELVDALAKTITGTKDREVQTNLLRALVRNGSETTRKRVLRLALKTGSPPLHRLAASALICEAEKVTSSDAAEIGDDQLRIRAPIVAVLLAFLVGLRADGGRVVAAARSLREIPTRQAVLLPLVSGAYMQSEEIGTEVRNELPLQLQEWCSDLPNTFPTLEASDLQSVGDISVVNAVADWLKVLHAKS